MTGGLTITDITLNANVTFVSGSDNETGTGTFYAKGSSESRVDLNLNDKTRTEVRRSSGGVPSGQWKKGDGSPAVSAQHNCWTDAAWFFPALSSLTETTNPNFTYSYLGQEQRDGLSVLHLRVIQRLPGDTPKLNLSRLGAMDFYLMLVLSSLWRLPSTF